MLQFFCCTFINVYTWWFRSVTVVIIFWLWKSEIILVYIWSKWESQNLNELYISPLYKGLVSGFCNFTQTARYLFLWGSLGPKKWWIITDSENLSKIENNLSYILYLISIIFFHMLHNCWVLNLCFIYG